MRLINTYTLELHEFHEPPWRYAILSHRWTEDECTLEDYQQGAMRDSIGYQKITRACAKAKQRRLEWLWVDTCCIDKKSSAELSEAINSMYRWYHEAVECYAYLADVSFIFQRTSAPNDPFHRSLESQVPSSSWFTRGWTLQELIAPSRVLFYGREWQLIGLKGTTDDEVVDEMDDETMGALRLEGTISLHTGIPEGLLSGNALLSQFCVAQKMSWLARRETTRVEDMAYCALGIFQINMPLLYGEGTRAWTRLQEEIIRNLDDESIFAWSAPDPRTIGLQLLSSEPQKFSDRGFVLSARLHLRLPYSLTNQGLQVQLAKGTAIEYFAFDGVGQTRALEIVLNCIKGVDDNSEGHYFTLHLLKKPCGHYERVGCDSRPFRNLTAKPKEGEKIIDRSETIYIHTTNKMAENCELQRAGRLAYSSIVPAARRQPSNIDYFSENREPSYSFFK